MRKIVIRPKRLYVLAKEFVRLHPLAEHGLEGGRPKTYPDALILTIATTQRLGDFSFREALEYCGYFFLKVPSLSSYHERLGTLPRGFIRSFIIQLGV